MSFEQKFTSVLNGGEKILGRLSQDRQCVKRTVDVLRTIIEAQLGSADSEIQKAEWASAAVLFKDLYPINTEAKLAIVNNLCKQIVDVAMSLSEDSEADEVFYRAQVGVKGSSLYGLMKGVVECVHYEWTNRIRDSIAAEKRAERWADIRALAKCYLWIVYLGLSGLFCLMACNDKSFWKFVLGCVPVLGQLYSVIMTFVTWGFGEGLKLIGSVVCTALLLGAIGGCVLDSHSEEKKDVA